MQQVKMPKLAASTIPMLLLQIFLNVLDFKPNTSAKQRYSPGAIDFPIYPMPSKGRNLYRKSKLQANISNSSVSTNDSP